MTDLDSRPAPPPPPEPPRQIPSWLLALMLSLILIAGWLVYLNVAPSPETLPPKEAETPAAAPPVPVNELHLLVWRNMLDNDVLSAFEAESGLKIVREDYDTREQLNAIIDGGRFTHDLVLTSGVDLKHLIARDLLQPAPAFANGAAVDAAIAARAAVYDPGNQFGVVAFWGTLGLAYDSAKAAARLEEGQTVDSWNILFDPMLAAKFADCGIQIVDSPRGVFPIALTFLGLPPDSAKAEDTEAATRTWEAVRPSIAAFATQGVVDNLAEGRTCMALATSSDAAQARAKAQAAGGPDIRYVLPKEGTIVWYDMLAVPKASANAAQAAKLIDYLLRPQIAARLTNAKGFANVVHDSALYVNPELQADKALLPDAAAAARFTSEIEPSPAAAALRDRFWQLINTPPAPPAPAPPER